VRILEKAKLRRAHEFLDVFVRHVLRTIETLEDVREELVGLLESRNGG